MTTRKNTQSSYSKELIKKYGRVSFGRFLKAWRDSEDLSQTEFSKLLDLSPANVNDLERGRRIPTPARAKKIAKKLKLPVIALVAMVVEDRLLREGLNYSVVLSEVA